MEMIRLARRAAAAIAVALALAVPRAAHAQTEISICSGQAVPPGYVVVRAYRGDQCPNYYEGTHNAVTIRLPGDTVTVCSQLTPAMPGYVVTAQQRSDACPNYYGPPNSARWQRLPNAAPPPPPPPPAAEGAEVMEVLDEYGRNVQRRMRAMEARFRLTEATHLPWTDAGPQGSVTRLGFNRKAGEPLTLIAACDQDCAEIQLRVLSPSGAVVATGEAGPESSVWLGAPQAVGMWTVEATVRTCRAEFCRFAVGIYQTSADAPPVPPRRPPLRPTRP
jgi:hypothetical protein